MKRLALVLFAFSFLAIGCKKDAAQPAADEAAKPVEGQPADPAATPPTEPAQPAEPAAATGDTAAAAQPAGDSVTGIAECDAYIKRYMACEKLPAEARAAFGQGVESWKQLSAAEETKGQVKTMCEEAAKAQEEALKAAGC